LRRPIVPDYCEHNAHMYYILLSEQGGRERLLDALKAAGVGAVFHYVPLHLSPAGMRYARVSGDLTVTMRAAEHLIRLPLFIGLTTDEQEKIVEIIRRFCASSAYQE
jgi:dTDP-4-amino-4,6-dideoxygalactose transaminase